MDDSVNANGLLQLHVEALFTRDATERLVTVNVPDGDPAPRVFLGRTPEGNTWWTRHDLDDALVRDLAELCESVPIGLDRESDAHRAPLVTRLSESEPVRKIWSGPAFRFPRDLPGSGDAVHVTSDNVFVLTPYFEDWVEDVQPKTPFTALLRDGKAVSICCSVRMTPEAHEAGVETHSDFRGRGLAARAIAAWASAVRKTSRTPLYSTSWDNHASLAVARKLGLVQFAADLHIT